MYVLAEMGIMLGQLAAYNAAQYVGHAQALHPAYRALIQAK
jgi:hypothetical protein